MVQVLGLVRIVQSHRDRLDFRFAEILEGERLDRLTFDPFVNVATPAVGAELSGPQHQGAATHHFHPLHKGYLRSESVMVDGGRDIKKIAPNQQFG
jgi:hypothetical protein